MIDDRKLLAVKPGVENPKNVYGSKEDDDGALKSLSAIEITENQSKESFASMVVKMLGKSEVTLRVCLAVILKNVSIIFNTWKIKNFKC